MPRRRIAVRPNCSSAAAAESNNPARTRMVNWTAERDLLLLGILKKQQVKGNGVSGNFPALIWLIILEEFKRNSPLEVKKENLQNRLKVLKQLYALYNALANKSGWSWDHVRSMPIAPQETEWPDIIAANPNYKKIKRVPFPQYDDMHFLCGGNIAVGHNGISTNMDNLSVDGSSDDDDDLEGVPMSTLNIDTDGLEENAENLFMNTDPTQSTGQGSNAEPSSLSAKRRRSVNPTISSRRRKIDKYEDRGYDLFRMSNKVFFLLKDELIARGVIKPTRWLGCNEQLAIFLHGIGHAVSNRVLAEMFQHSGETISRHFNNVLKGILMLRTDYIQMPTINTPTHPRISNDPAFYPYFKNALGAIDGTHIPAVVRLEKQTRYRCRKNFVSQNVMAAVSFDHTFMYVSSGWEGSAADMKVLRWALDSGGFSVPDGKYYLVDSGYANTIKFLAPYRGVRYHLSEYRNRGSRRYTSSRDKYNHRHAQLCNAVEKTFGILKRRFKILRYAVPYPYKTQCRLVLACCVIHNFISRHTGNDRYFNMLNGLEEWESDEDDDDVDLTVPVGLDESRRGDRLRTLITNQLANA